jgi:TatD DNase family protein
MFIDTHCHLTDKYTDGLESVINNAANTGVNIMICPTADPADIPHALQIANTNDNIFCTIGIHPEYAPADATKYLTDEVLQNPRVVGVGEIGLDYHYSPETRDIQIKLFEQQLEIAKKHSLPVAIHTRDAESDTAAILKGDISGVMHCFTSSWDLAKTMLDRGFFFSASGILTFKNSAEIRETFSKIPVDRIVIETDAPYLAPHPFRGKINHSGRLLYTAGALAEARGSTLEQTAALTYQNAKTFFGI